MANSDYSVELTAKLKWGESKKNIQEQLSQATFLIHAKLYADFKSTIQKQLSETSFKLNVGSIDTSSAKVNLDSGGLNSARESINSVVRSTGAITEAAIKAKNTFGELNEEARSLFNINDQYRQVLKTIGLDPASVEKSVKELEAMKLSLKQISTEQSSFTDKKGGVHDTFKVFVTAEDQYGKMVRMSQTFIDGQKEASKQVLKVTEKVKEQAQAVKQVTDAANNKSFSGVDFTISSKNFDDLQRKIRDLNIDESTLTYTTADLVAAYDKISDSTSLGTFNTMLSQATKEVANQEREINKSNKSLQDQEKEWQKLTDLINKAYGEATNSNTNGKAIQDPATIKLLRDQYDTVIATVNEVRNATTDTFAQSKKSAEQAIQAFIEYSKVLQNSEQSIQATDNAIKKLQSDTSKGLFAQNSGNSEVVQLRQDIDNLSNQYAQLQSRFQNEGATQEVIQGFTQLDNQIKSTSERAKELQTSLKSARDAAALEDRKSNLNNKIETWLRNNTRASESMRQSMKSLQTQIQSADKQTLTHLTQQFNELNRTAQQTGQIGKSALDIFKEKAAKFAGWFGLANAFMMITNEAKQALVTLKDVDSILTEISKTSERSAESLEQLGETAFDAASKYGVSVQNYLTGVQEMARAGYETLGEHQSEQMAELALLVQAAGDVSDSVARDYLIATDAAYQLGGSIEKLTSILDSQNMVTNNYAVSMQDMTEATKEAASVANQYGISIEELSALIAIAEARTKQGGNVVGNAIKSLLLQLSDVTNNQVVKAFDTVGISMHKMVDGSKQLKTPIELLGELAKVFNELPQGDDRRSVVLSDLGGKHRANTLAAILQDWDSMQGIMETYERGAGSAMREANFYLYVQKCA